MDMDFKIKEMSGLLCSNYCKKF